MTTTPPRPRGHWPAGRRRNDPGPEWRRVRAALALLLTHHHKRNLISLRVAARHVGVDPRTLSRWLRGIDLPDSDAVNLIRGFLAKHDHLLGGHRATK